MTLNAGRKLVVCLVEPTRNRSSFGKRGLPAFRFSRICPS